MTQSIVIVDAPSPLGLWESGVEKIPEALKRHRLTERLKATQGPRLAPPPFSKVRDVSTGFLNGPSIAAYSRQLAGELEGIWKNDGLPVILGGDCSILIGAAIGLKRRGRYGLLFVDGHADYYRSHQSPTGEVADMDLAIVTGANHALLSDIEGLQPYFKAADTVAFGIRDEKLAREHGSQDIRKSGISVLSLDDIRERGFETSLDAAIGRLTAPGLDGSFLHFDVDVLSDDIMPAVDYRMPDGLSFAEASAIIEAARKSGRLMGITLTIFNPKLDPDGTIAGNLTDCLVAGLSEDK
jgi:arginase